MSSFRVKQGCDIELATNIGYTYILISIRQNIPWNQLWYWLHIVESKAVESVYFNTSPRCMSHFSTGCLDLWSHRCWLFWWCWAESWKIPPLCPQTAGVLCHLDGRVNHGFHNVKMLSSAAVTDSLAFGTFQNVYNMFNILRKWMVKYSPKLCLNIMHQL